MLMRTPEPPAPRLSRLSNLQCQLRALLSCPALAQRTRVTHCDEHWLQVLLLVPLTPSPSTLLKSRLTQVVVHVQMDEYWPHSVPGLYVETTLAPGHARFRNLMDGLALPGVGLAEVLCWLAGEIDALGLLAWLCAAYGQGIDQTGVEINLMQPSASIIGNKTGTAANRNNSNSGLKRVEALSHTGAKASSRPVSILKQPQPLALQPCEALHQQVSDSASEVSSGEDKQREKDKTDADDLNNIHLQINEQEGKSLADQLRAQCAYPSAFTSFRPLAPKEAPEVKRTSDFRLDSKFAFVNSFNLSNKVTSVAKQGIEQNQINPENLSPRNASVKGEHKPMNKNANLPKFLIRIFIKYIDRFKSQYVRREYERLLNECRRIKEWKKNDRRQHAFGLKHLKQFFQDDLEGFPDPRLNRRIIARIIDEYLLEEICQNSQIPTCHRAGYLLACKVFAIRCRNVTLAGRIQSK